MQQDQHSVAAIGKRVAVVIIDACGRQALHHETIDLLSQFFLDRVGPPGRVLDVQREDASMNRERRFPAWQLAIPR